jgi:hypothetical protein
LDLGSVVKNDGASSDHGCSRFSPEEVHLPFKFILGPKVVVVEKRDKLSPSLGETAVSGGRLTGVGLLEVSDSASVAQRFEDAVSIVRRPIVDHDDFVILKGLREDGVQRCQDEIPVVVSGNDDTDLRIGHDS